MATKFEDVKLGDELHVDTNFSCMSAGAVKEVMQTRYGELYIECDEGKHYLDAQKSAHGNLTGLTLVTESNDDKEKSTT